MKYSVASHNILIKSRHNILPSYRDWPGFLIGVWYMYAMDLLKKRSGIRSEYIDNILATTEIQEKVIYETR